MRANWSATGPRSSVSRLTRAFVRRDSLLAALSADSLDEVTNERAVGAGDLMETRGRVVLGPVEKSIKFGLDLAFQVVLT